MASCTQKRLGTTSLHCQHCINYSLKLEDALSDLSFIYGFDITIVHSENSHSMFVSVLILYFLCSVLCFRGCHFEEFLYHSCF